MRLEHTENTVYDPHGGKWGLAMIYAQHCEGQTHLGAMAVRAGEFNDENA
jgi:hypothetical protein